MCLMLPALPSRRTAGSTVMSLYRREHRSRRAKSVTQRHSGPWLWDRVHAARQLAHDLDVLISNRSAARPRGFALGPGVERVRGQGKSHEEMRAQKNGLRLTMCFCSPTIPSANVVSTQDTEAAFARAIQNRAGLKSKSSVANAAS